VSEKIFKYKYKIDKHKKDFIPNKFTVEYVYAMTALLIRVKYHCW